MFDDDLTAFLESGCSTVVGLLTPDGAPFATRAWGTLVLPSDPPRLRILLGAGELAAVGRHAGDAAAFPIAVTSAHVLTLRAVQVKGTARELEPVDADDVERSARFCDALFADILAVDDIERWLMERLAPTDLVACTVDVAEVYDQTPGPGAGALLSSR